MQGKSAVLALAAAVLAAAVTAKATAPKPAAVTLVPSSAVTCMSVGPYRTPDPGSAGSPAGLVLCPSGPLRVVRAGAVLDGWAVTGGIVVDAQEVVVRRSRVTGDGTADFGVVTTSAGSVRIEDTTLAGDFRRAAVGGDRWSGERLAIGSVTHDGVHLGDRARLRNSVVRDAGAGSAALVIERGRGVVVEDSDVDAGGRAAAAVRATGGEGTIRSSTLGGGRWTLQMGTGADVLVTDNRFRRDAAAGPLRVPPGVVHEDNTFVDGGLLPPG